MIQLLPTYHPVNQNKGAKNQSRLTKKQMQIIFSRKNNAINEQGNGISFFKQKKEMESLHFKRRSKERNQETRR